MTSEYFLGHSPGWTTFFVILVIVAVGTQLTKTTKTKSLPAAVRHLLKAAPALLLAGLLWKFQAPLLVPVAFLLCACGDIFLDFDETEAPWAFKVGALAFAAALICLSITYLGKPFPGHGLWPLWVTNFVIAIFVLRWVLPNLKGTLRILEICYFGILIISNIIASSSTVPIFLGSSLWLMSDLSIGLGENVVAAKTKVNSLDTLGLYDVGLYCIALGFINS